MLKPDARVQSRGRRYACAVNGSKKRAVVMAGGDALVVCERRLSEEMKWSYAQMSLMRSGGIKAYYALVGTLSLADA